LHSRTEENDVTWRPRLDSTITFGNLLTVITLVVAATLFVFKLDSRLAFLERVVENHENRIGRVEGTLPR